VAIDSAEGERELGALGPARFDSWHFARDTERYSGGRAFAPLLEELPGGRALAGIARRLEFVTVPAYNLVASHRSAISRLVPAGSKRRAGALIEARVRGVRSKS
jgi:predicted DCC family thiol-disulfide oxidoreductase YuxK